jgi:uncharacterized protein YifN (PemK superfamily)
MCDFDSIGFQAPMMTKKRRVVVMQRRLRTHSPQTILVVPLSTTPPPPARVWHHEIPAGRYSFLSVSDSVYVKGDMVYAVPVSSLDRLQVKGTWEAPVLPREEFAAVQNAVREALAL